MGLLFAVYGVAWDQFELRWLKRYVRNPSYNHHQIGSINLSHYCHIFPWLCVWGGCTIIYCNILHIYPGNTGTLLPILMWSLWYMQMIGCFMSFRSCSFVCELNISLSSLCGLVCLKALNKQMPVPMVYSSLNYLLFNIRGCVYSAYPIHLRWS